MNEKKLGSIEGRRISRNFRTWSRNQEKSRPRSTVNTYANSTSVHTLYQIWPYSTLNANSISVYTVHQSESSQYTKYNHNQPSTRKLNLSLHSIPNVTISTINTYANSTSVYTVYEVRPYQPSTMPRPNHPRQLRFVGLVFMLKQWNNPNETIEKSGSDSILAHWFKAVTMTSEMSSTDSFDRLKFFTLTLQKHSKFCKPIAWFLCLSVSNLFGLLFLCLRRTNRQTDKQTNRRTARLRDRQTERERELPHAHKQT